VRLPPLSTPARELLRICLLKAGPQDLPFSRELLALAMAGSLGLGYPALSTYSDTPTPGVDLLATALFSLGFVYAALSLRGLLNRFTQTATAVFGTDILITAIAVPFLYAGNTPLATLMMLVIGIWNLVVLGHILRHALSVPLPGGILAAMAYVFGSTFFTRLLHGG
jgi:hypothetical protein